MRTKKPFINPMVLEKALVLKKKKKKKKVFLNFTFYRGLKHLQVENMK